MSKIKREPVVQFTFDDPVPMMDRRDLVQYLEVLPFGKYYEPPISFDGLAKTFRASVHHSSPILLKRNLLVRSFIPHKKLTTLEFSKHTMDFLVLGNSYFEAIPNRLGSVARYEAPLGKYVRVGRNVDTFFYVTTFRDEFEFKNKIYHLMDPDINQDIYGMPEYIPALQSAWLNEESTLFRRRYYKNGSHAGFILYMTDAAQKQEDVDALRDALKNAKGPGNFRNLFMYAPNGKKDGIQLIPVSEVAAKDEFFNIKNITRDDQLAMHRTPAQLVGIIPSNTGGFGDVEKAFAVFNLAEIDALQTKLLQFNEWAGEEIIKFKPLELSINQGTKQVSS